ncbi:MAG: DUF3892 domain-containing protein [Cyclobacteriaceae bacterium]|nr:DUF3892 domain-containing protein [Cyclobacteriaceae bacterium]
MTSKHRISCITKSSTGSEPHERITSIGGINYLRDDFNPRWSLSVERAISGIESNELEFYIRKQSEVVKVIVAEWKGKKYLKTEKDDDQPDGLLELPEC